MSNKLARMDRERRKSIRARQDKSPYRARRFCLECGDKGIDFNPAPTCPSCGHIDIYGIEIYRKDDSTVLTFTSDVDPFDVLREMDNHCVAWNI